MVYPKESSRDDFAMAPAAKMEVVEVDRCRDEYFQIPPLHFDHFLFTKYIKIYLNIHRKYEIFYDISLNILYIERT